MENDANVANYDELGAHITRLKSKLDTMQIGTDQYGETKELLEDYYERLLQMKNMSIDTLKCYVEELEGSSSTEAKRFQKHQRFLTAVLLVLVATVGLLLEDRSPGAISTPTATVTSTILNSTPAVVAITAITAHFLTRWHNKK